MDTLPTTTALRNSLQLLRIYVYYRLFLSSVLGTMFWAGIGSNVLGSENAVLFERSIILFVITAVTALILLWCDVLRPSPDHVAVLLITDFIALIILIYASGGVDTGLGYLLLISMAIGSIFIRGEINIGLAALAALLLMSMSVINMLYGNGTTQEIFSSGITGILLFVTALTFSLLANRIQTSEQLALEQSQNVAAIQQLAQRIIERMRTGLVVLDKDLHVRLINGAAINLLELKDDEPLNRIPEIDERLKQWQRDDITPQALNLNLPQPIKVNFSVLKDPNNASIMLFVEDTQQFNQEVQQLKLASLGRLTASIAHEIRNPLGAISHASQLLDESNTISGDDARLLHIIQNHSERINHIITNVLQMSRRRSAKPEVLELKEWLSHFKEEYLRHNEGEIHTQWKDEPIRAKMDQSHLHQIISNLIDNGMRYSQQSTGTASIHLHAYVDSATELPYIDVIDQGPGISDEMNEQIFEPFFTTEVTGSGLGLYLCKELCQANQAKLSYLRLEGPNGQSQSCFRIQLCHYMRNI